MKDFFARDTPVPSRSSGLRPSELKWLWNNLPKGVRKANQAQKEVIDLTGDDSDENMALTSFTLAFRPKPIETPQMTATPSPGAQLPHSSSPLNAHVPHTNHQSSGANKRKEPESREENSEERWNAKRLRQKPRENRPLPSIEMDEYEDDNIYEVEQVLALRRQRGRTEYMLAWVGYPEVTWRSASDCHCQALIHEFLAAPQLCFRSESAEGKALETSRKRRQQDAKNANAPKPPKVKAQFRNRINGRFARRPRLPSVIPDSEDEGDDWSDFVRDTQREQEHNFSSSSCDKESETSKMPVRKPAPSCCSPPTFGANQLPSPSTSSSLPNTKTDSDSVWIHVRATPVHDSRPPQTLVSAEAHGQRPKQTARMNWTADVPGPELSVKRTDVSPCGSTIPKTTRILPPLAGSSAQSPHSACLPLKSTATQPPSAHVEALPGQALEDALAMRPPGPIVPAVHGTGMNKRPVCHPQLPILPPLARTEVPEPRKTFFGRPVDNMPDLQQRMSAVVERLQRESESELRRQSERKARRSQTQNQRKEATNSGQVLRKISHGRIGDNKRVFRKSSAERKIDMERRRATAVMEAELNNGRGVFDDSKKKVGQLLANASAEASRRAPLLPSASMAQVRDRSESMATESFRTAIEQIQIEKRDRGFVRPELRGDVGPVHARSLLERARILPPARPFVYRPDGFQSSSSSETLMQSTEA